LKNKIRPKKKKLLVSSHPTDPNSNPQPFEIFSFFPNKKKMPARERYPSTMTVTDIFHDKHLPVDKTSIVTARVVVSEPDVSKKKFQSKIKFHSYLPTLFFFLP
jgi:hypothetical protein